MEAVQWLGIIAGVLALIVAIAEITFLFIVVGIVLKPDKKLRVPYKRIAPPPRNDRKGDGKDGQGNRV